LAVTVCATCGQDNPERARFCLACGTLLSEAPRSREVRKTVTILFADVAESTALGERLDPEPLRALMTRYFQEAQQVLEYHGGTVEKFIGDAVVAVFGVPVVHEDDALRAVRAALDLRKALGRVHEELARPLGVDLAVRMGLNTGEVVAGDPGVRQTFATGDAVNVAARLEQAAGPGEILVGETTLALVRDAVSVEPLDNLVLRGREQHVRAHRLIELRSDAAWVGGRTDTRLVGREHELRLLTDAFERSERERRCHLFTIFGAAGVGKSRLVEEFASIVDESARIVRGRCLPYGDGITYWPVVEVVKDAAGLTGEESASEATAHIAALASGEPDARLVAERVAGLVGVAGAASGGEESFWAVRKLLEAIARDRSLVVVLDDVHWGEPTFLDLVDHVVEWSRDAPLVVVCLARPELLDVRSGWGGGKPNATSLLLEPLKEEESAVLIADRLGGLVDDEISRRVIDLAEGNPLFLEEMLAVLVDDELVERDNGGWAATTDLAEARVPATIQALLAARVDQLHPDERIVLERGSIEGKVFHRGFVRALAGSLAVDAHLDSLVKKELLRPDRAALPGEEAFRFRHILIRDAAYESMPKEARAELHERYADWLAALVGVGTLEHDEIVAYHLEQAHRLRRELGRRDDTALAHRAAERLATAGRRAGARDDIPAAASFFRRAIALLPDDDPARLRLLVPLARAMVENGELDAADAVLVEAAERGDVVGDRQLALAAQAERHFIFLQADPGSTEQARAVAREALELFEKLGDEAGLAAIWDLVAHIHLMECQYAERARALERALTYARRAGVEREADILIALETAHYWGPTPVEECLARTERRLGEVAGRLRTVEAALLGMRAGLEAMRGRFDEARDFYATAREMQEDLGRAYSVASWTIVGARVEMLAGDPAAAEAELRRGYQILEPMGERGVLSTLAAYLADAVYAQGRYQEAESLTRVSEEAAAEDDIASQIWWRLTRAKLLARAGDTKSGEAVARTAVMLAEPIDDLSTRARALLDLGEVLRLSGRSEETDPFVEKAVRLLEQKGDLVSLGRARAARAAQM
jgi:predicted ATPase/class 3 adenylate cyclase